MDINTNTIKINTITNTASDELQKKIENARMELSEETRHAIDMVDWKSAILSLRDKKGYNLEQLDDLETETELLLCGLTNPEEYPKELETRMKIPRTQVDILVNELNELVFKKIRDELMKTNEAETNIVNKEAENKKNTQIFSGAGIEIMPEEITMSKKDESMGKPSEMLSNIENPELINKEVQNEKILKSISSQKLSGSFQIPTVKTEYTLNNISKQNTTNPTPTPIDTSVIKPKIDPYREIPE